MANPGRRWWVISHLGNETHFQISQRDLFAFIAEVNSISIDYMRRRKRKRKTLHQYIYIYIEENYWFSSCAAAVYYGVSFPHLCEGTQAESKTGRGSLSLLNVLEVHKVLFFIDLFPFYFPVKLWFRFSAKPLLTYFKLVNPTARWQI